MKKINLYAKRLSLAIGSKVYRNDTNFELCSDGIRDINTRIVVCGLDEMCIDDLRQLADNLGLTAKVF